jgi:hypothetical protein
VRAVLRLVAHELLARWRGWVLLGLLVGVAGGAVLTAAAGARRTDSACSRFLVASRAADVFVAPFDTGLDGYTGLLLSCRTWLWWRRWWV